MRPERVQGALDHRHGEPLAAGSALPVHLERDKLGTVDRLHDVMVARGQPGMCNRRRGHTVDTIWPQLQLFSVTCRDVFWLLRRNATL